MVKIVWTKWSLRDLKLIYEYIKIDSPLYASRFINSIVARTDQLINFPESGRVVPEKDNSNIRELIEGNYRIFYKLQRHTITILRIHHSARQIK